MAERLPTQKGLDAGLIFGVVIRPQTYLRILYLLLSFPLGIGYFVFLVTGLALGFGLMITWLGIPILLLVLAVTWVLTQFERALAILLVQVDIPPITSPIVPDVGWWSRLKTHLKNPLTWTGMVYLLLKFPLGIASFVAVVTTVSVSVAFITAPLHYPWWETSIRLGFWGPDSFGDALVMSVMGIVLALVSLHGLNLLAWVCGRVAWLMLGSVARRSQT